MNKEERMANIVAYVGTIVDYIGGMSEEEILEVIKKDCELMDEEAARFTLDNVDEIIEVALEELGEE